jgi:hypothetical protein
MYNVLYALDKVLKLVSQEDPGCLLRAFHINRLSSIKAGSSYLVFTEDNNVACSFTQQQIGRTGGKQVINIGNGCLLSDGRNNETAALIEIMIKALGGTSIEHLKYIYHCEADEPHPSTNKCPNSWIHIPEEGVCYKPYTPHFSLTDETSYLVARNVCASIGGHIMHIPPFTIMTTSEVFKQMITREVGHKSLPFNQWRIGVRGVRELGNNSSPLNRWKLGIRGVGAAGGRDVEIDNRMVNETQHSRNNLGGEGFMERAPFYWDYGDARAPLKVWDVTINEKLSEILSRAAKIPEIGDGFSLYNEKHATRQDGTLKISIGEADETQGVLAYFVPLDIDEQIRRNPVPFYCEKPARSEDVIQ